MSKKPNPALTSLVALLAIYLAAALCLAAFLVSLRRGYVPFDASNLLFVHYRLPHQVESANRFLLIAGVWFTAFLALIVVLTRSGIQCTRGRVAVVLVLQAAVSILFCAVPIAMDSDQFDYVAYAYAAEHENPYESAPLPPGAPAPVVQAFRHWGNPLPPLPYGPAWILLSEKLLAPVATAPIWVQALILRIAAILAGCAATLCLALALRERSLAAVALFALNPLVVLETGNGAHNDIWVVLCAVAAIALLARGKAGFAGMLLGLATVIKYAYGPFILPLAIATFARFRRLREPVAMLAGWAIVIGVFAAPFGLTNALLTPLHRLGSRERGNLSFADRALRHIPLLGPHAVTVVDSIVLLALAACIALLCVDAARRRLSVPLVITTTVLVLLLPGKFEPWYAMIATPLLLVPARSARIAFAAITGYALFLVQSSFTGIFDLLPALACAVVIAVAMQLALVVRVPI